VVGPAEEEKIGTATYSCNYSIDCPHNCAAPIGAKRKGLLPEVHDTMEGMERRFITWPKTLAHSNPAAMTEMKKLVWKGTEHWDPLLKEKGSHPAGRLDGCEFTRHRNNKFKAEDC
jgi:methylglutaconyl-CoA hydratase